MSSQHISLFGVGNMGAALGRALLNAGFKLTIWNRTANRPQVTALVQAGASYESNLHTAISKSDGLLLFCVVDYDAMYRLLEPLGAASDALEGKTVVNVTNGTPRQAVAMNAWIKARGARYFDGSVLVTPEMIATPHSLLVYSGEGTASFDAHVRPVVQALGTPLYQGPAVDAAAARDLAMLAAMYGLFQGALIGFGILQRSGFAVGPEGDGEATGGSGDGGLDGGDKGRRQEVAPWTESVTTPSMIALAPLLTRLAKTVDAQSWADNGGNPLGMMLAGIDNITQAAGDLGINADGLVSLAEAMRRAVEDGHADGDFAVTSQYLLK